MPFTLTFPLINSNTTMRKAFILITLISGLVTGRLSAQCQPGEAEIRLEVNTDKNYFQKSWTLTSMDESIVYGSGTPVDSATNVFTYCVPELTCVKFNMKDAGYSGFFPDGFFKLYINGNLVYQRVHTKYLGGQTETVVLNCVPGSSCVDVIPINLGAGFASGTSESWFKFDSKAIGLYEFSTCGAACHTKLWLYDRCTDIYVAESQYGTISYSLDGCADSSALMQMQLDSGKTYYIRLRYQNPDCSTEPIHYTFSYLGPISGCMDPLACNYEPLATVDGGNCLYFGDPNCPKGPDLVINEPYMRSTLSFEDYEASDPCLISDGCIKGMGLRQIIRFGTHITNTGDADFYIGKRPVDTTSVTHQFVFDPCHHHWHYIGYAEYVLYNAQGYRVPIGTKAGFCVYDNFCFGVDRKFNCVNMGISHSCGDVYDKFTDCQWIDITGIPPGDYTLVNRVNWDKKPDRVGRIEKSFDNNWAQACFTLVYDGNTPDVIFHDDTCPKFTDCLGEVYGNAVPDCNGVCNGPALTGDWNQDTLRNQTDVAAYLNAALEGNTGASLCTDLHDDARINIFDAALLLECNIHADTPQYWIQRFPCQFPTGFLNIQDLVTLRIGNLDTMSKAFDLEIVNPYHDILGYEFSLAGVQIEAVENLVSGFHGIPAFNASSGKIIALAQDESVIGKNQLPASFMRVHYSGFTDTVVCIKNIEAVINAQYQQSNASIGIPDCISVKTVGIKEPGNASFGVYVQPNPMRQSTTLFFSNPDNDVFRLVLQDMTGRTLRYFPEIHDSAVTIERKELPEGTYIFTLSNGKGSVSGKILIQ